MSQDRDRIDRESAERMLDAIAAHPDADWSTSDPLPRVLAAASAPASAEELAGVEAAVAAFREQAGSDAVSARAPRKVAAGSLPIVRLLSAKVAIAAMAVTAAGGIALASATDQLPMSAWPGGGPPTARPTTAHGTGGQQPSGAEPSTPGPGVPSPETVRRCEVYEADPAEAMRDPALIAAAGGSANVHGYCTRVLTEARSPQPPTPSERSTPSVPPATQPGKATKRKPTEPPAGSHRPSTRATPVISKRPKTPGQHQRPDFERPSPPR
jgi:hypothetical protein